MPRFRVEVRGTYIQGRYVEAKNAAEARRMVASGEDESADAEPDDMIHTGSNAVPYAFSY